MNHDTFVLQQETKQFYQNKKNKTLIKNNQIMKNDELFYCAADFPAINKIKLKLRPIKNHDANK